MNKFSFTKMHGLGNDFVIINLDNNNFNKDKSVIKQITSRRTGIGCDQLILIEKSTDQISDAKILIYNADGSESETCGNALRCVGSLLFEEYNKINLTLETKGGLVDVEKNSSNLICVDMGLVKFNWDEIPLSHPLDTTNLNINLKYLKQGYAVNIGNPHVVFFSKNLGKEEIKNDCKAVSKLKIFPKGVNINVVNIISKNTLKLTVFERGVGFTTACGSGACASSVVASILNLCDKKTKVIMEGGELFIEFLNDKHVLMTGPSSKVFEGSIDLSNLIKKV